MRYNLQDVRVFPGPLIRAKATSLICTGTASTQKIWQLTANIVELSVSYKNSKHIDHQRNSQNFCSAQECEEHYTPECVVRVCFCVYAGVLRTLYTNMCMHVHKQSTEYHHVPQRKKSTLLPSHLASIISSNLLWYLFPRTCIVV